MERCESYVKTLGNIKSSMDRCNNQLKDLRMKKKLYETQLYTLMKSQNIDTCGNYSLAKLTPKTKPKAKPKKQRERDERDYLMSQGISDPDTLLQSLKDLRTIRDE
jgi:hypothetical protein